ncbi:hydroxyacylglutathione hydrolase [Deltaproteobacteria bacterium]|nr:hydroxyacylglutathione hydrolase [Deltaproteobacteria bacterium]
MRVVRIPCLTDNQAYWLPDLGVVVDPSEAAPVLDALEGAPLRAVWCTHHHPDHVGGIAGLIARFPGLRVYGSGKRPIAGLTHELADGEQLEGATILAVPGHTLDALAFYLPDGEGDVFVGDTLFAMGCGRLFEGDASMMWASLQRLRALPATTRVWFGHDYAARNLQFSTAILPVDREPAPPPIALRTERMTNLFLRADDPDVAAAVGRAPGLATFSELRERRDRF